MSQAVDRTQPVIVRERDAGSDHRRLLDQVLERTLESGFDAEAFHVMDQRDTRLIQDEIMGGPRSSKFMYDFEIQGKKVTGVSAIGARELATYYKGIRHRLVSSTRKIGALYIFTTYPMHGVPPSMTTTHLPELANEPDGYEAVCEVEDVKTGITMMASKFEAQWEWSSKNSNYFEKPHFATIAQSKAQRNGILMVIPQHIQLEWMDSLRDVVAKKESITTGVLQEKRDGVLRFAASKGIAIKRDVLETLLLEQIMGLSEAARTKDEATFQVALIALNLVELKADTQETETKTDKPAPRRGRSPNPAREPPAKPAGEDPNAWRSDPTGEKAEADRQKTSDGQAASSDAQSGSGDTPQTSAESGRAEGFEAWLVDQDGTETRPEPYVDAVTFARALQDLCAGKHAETIDAIFEQNGGAIEDARDNPDAAKIIDHIAAPEPQDDAGQSTVTTEATNAPEPLAVPLTPRNTPDWTSYITAANKAIDALPSAEAVEAWLKLNRPSFIGRSMQTETKIERHAKDRRASLSGETATQADPDDNIIASLTKALSDCKDKAQLARYKEMDGVKHIKARFRAEGKAARLEQLEKLFADREASLPQ